VATDRYDIIIIGTGAGGGTLAYRLAPTGKRILVLERGDFLPREKQNWDTTAVFLESKYKAKETWYGKDGRFQPGIHYYVGGNTKFYGALRRFTSSGRGTRRSMPPKSWSSPVARSTRPCCCCAQPMTSIRTG
jgi:choline dehydrogenase-like flavoprotein